MDLIKAVKKLGKKLTGNDYNSTDLVSLVDSIADDYEGSSDEMDIGDPCLFVETNNFFGLAYLKYGDLVLYDNDSDAPYVTTYSFSAAMNLTIVLRVLDSASTDDYSFDGVFYGESGNADTELEESAYTWDSETGYLTITIPSFEADEPVISPVFTYQS